MRGRTWHVVPGFACRPRYARVCDGFCGRARRWTALMSRTDYWAPSPPQTGRPAAGRVAGALRAVGPPLLFGLRLWASVCLALYVAFWLELENPLLAGTPVA